MPSRLMKADATQSTDWSHIEQTISKSPKFCSDLRALFPTAWHWSPLMMFFGE
jgi:hypothetical protein